MTRAPLGAGEIREIKRHGETLRALLAELRRRIVGQNRVVEDLLISLLAEGHCLIIGVPGLAKTLLVSTLAELMQLSFKRIQFTPDLMPNDITGATIISEGSGDSQGERTFRFLKGPVFCNLLLADEINRTPPKTQAALMEAMEERQITAHGRRHRLERPFFVLATQNPIEQEGTYPLPVSQIDRFLFTVLIDYPTTDEEFEILERTTSAYTADMPCVIDREKVIEMIDLARRVHVRDSLVDYATRLVRSSRPDGREDVEAVATDSSGTDTIADWVSWGGGPRAIQAIIAGARGHAFLCGRGEVSADDIHRVVFPALRHRILLNFHGEAEGIATDDVIEKLLLRMPDGLYRRPEPSSRRPRRRGLLGRLLGER